MRKVTIPTSFCFAFVNQKIAHTRFPYISSDREFTGGLFIVKIAIPECVFVSNETSDDACFGLLLSDENGATLVALAALP